MEDIEKNIDFDFINLNKHIFFINNAKDIGFNYSESRLVDFYNNINANIHTKDIRKLALLRMIYMRLPNIDKSSILLSNDLFNDDERKIILMYVDKIIEALFTNKISFKGNNYTKQIDFIKNLN